MGKHKKRGGADKAISRTLTAILEGKGEYAIEQERLSRLGLSVGPSLEKDLEEVKSGLEEDIDTLARRLTDQHRLVVQAVASLLVKRKDVSRLAGLRQRLQTRDTQKLIARALHQLEAQGISVPRELDTRSSRVRGLPSGSPEAFMSHRDAWGELLTGVFVPGDGAELFLYAILSERHGFEEIQTIREGARAIRREFKTMQRGPSREFRIVPVEVSHVLYRLHEAASMAEVCGTHVPLELWPVLERIEETWNIEPQPGRIANSDSLSPLTGVDTDELLPLCTRSEVLAWHVDDGLIERMTLQVSEAVTSRLVLGDQMKQNRLLRVLREGALQYFEGDRRERYQARLEDTALFLERRGELEVSVLAYRTVLALADPEVPIEHIPFAIAFMMAKLYTFACDREANGGGAGLKEAMATLVGDEPGAFRRDEDEPLILVP